MMGGLAAVMVLCLGLGALGGPSLEFVAIGLTLDDIYPSFATTTTPSTLVSRQPLAHALVAGRSREIACAPRPLMRTEK